MSFLQPGTVFAKDFRIIRHLSSGGMGSVFVVEQLSTGKERALKVMHLEFSSDSAHRARFESEARISASIESDHVVEVLAAGVDTESNIPWLVMELLRGDTLEGHVDRSGPMAHSAIRECARQLRHVLVQAHMLGLVHRDLKPENLFLAAARRQDVPFTLKVLDFGIAKWAQEVKGTLKNSQMLGSPLWMAPEQLRPGSIISSATDVWALGLIVYYLLTATHYWATANASDASITGLLMEMASEPMPPPSERAKAFAPQIALPPGFDAWFEHTTNRDASKRYENAGHCLDALIELLAAPEATPAPPVGPRPSSISFDTSPIAESDDPEMLLRIARVYELRDTDKPRAVEAYRRVIELNPASHDAYSSLATLLDRMERFVELDALLEKEAESLPKGPRAATHWQRIATLRKEKLGDLSGYGTAMRAAFEQNPLDRVVMTELVKSLAESRAFGDIDALLEAARAAGQTPSFVEGLAGEAAEARGDLASAEAAYARALEGDAPRDTVLLTKFARSASSSKTTSPEEIRARWTRVLELDLEHVEAWAGILAVLADANANANDELATVGDAAVAVLGELAPEAARALVDVTSPKPPPLSFTAKLLGELAETSLAPIPELTALLAQVGPKSPLSSFGLSLKELVDPMTSSRALLNRAMPVYKQLSVAGAALDLPSTRQVYFREGGSAGFTCLFSEPPAVVIGADLTAFAAEEIVFAAFEFLARMRPELDAHFVLSQLPIAPPTLAPEVRAYLIGVERAVAKVGLLAARRLRAVRRPLASRACVHADAHLTTEALFRELALFVASGAYAKALASALEHA